MASEIIMTMRLPADLAEAILDYWHKQRLPSRSAAVRELLLYALEKQGKPVKDTGA
jgi:hypothetical protein